MDRFKEGPTMLNCIILYYFSPNLYINIGWSIFAVTIIGIFTINILKIKLYNPIYNIVNFVLKNLVKKITKITIIIVIL